VYALLDQMASAVGLATTPDFYWVYALATALARMTHRSRRTRASVRLTRALCLQVVVNSLCYTTLLHVLYALILGRMEGIAPDFGAVPPVLKLALMPDRIA
jgi:hypothetical protein